MQQTSLYLFWLFMKLLVVGVVLAFIIAAILVHTNSSGAQTFNSIFQIIP